MKTDRNYSASDCFETFPFPAPRTLAAGGALSEAGAALYAARAAYLVEHEIGLTKLYNALTDPSDQRPAIVALRRLHEAVDAAVLAAYGWASVTVPPYETLADAAPRKAFDAAVIDALFAENARQARCESRGEAVYAEG